MGIAVVVGVVVVVVAVDVGVVGGASDTAAAMQCTFVQNRLCHTNTNFIIVIDSHIIMLPAKGFFFCFFHRPYFGRS